MSIIDDMVKRYSEHGYFDGQFQEFLQRIIDNGNYKAFKELKEAKPYKLVTREVTSYAFLIMSSYKYEDKKYGKEGAIFYEILKRKELPLKFLKDCLYFQYLDQADMAFYSKNHKPNTQEQFEELANFIIDNCDPKQIVPLMPNLLTNEIIFEGSKIINKIFDKLDNLAIDNTAIASLSTKLSVDEPTSIKIKKAVALSLRTGIGFYTDEDCENILSYFNHLSTKNKDITSLVDLFLDGLISNDNKKLILHVNRLVELESVDKEKVEDWIFENCPKMLIYGKYTKQPDGDKKFVFPYESKYSHKEIIGQIIKMDGLEKAICPEFHGLGNNIENGYGMRVYNLEGQTFLANQVCKSQNADLMATFWSALCWTNNKAYNDLIFKMQSEIIKTKNIDAISHILYEAEIGKTDDECNFIIDHKGFVRDFEACGLNFLMKVLGKSKKKEKGILKKNVRCSRKQIKRDERTANQKDNALDKTK